MSDTVAVPTITKVEKEKDPRRVASGKRLALVSAAAKAKKKMERMGSVGVKEVEHQQSGGYSTSTLIAGIGVLSGLACLYLAYKQDVRGKYFPSGTSKREPQQKLDEPIIQPNPRAGKQYSLDD